MAVLQSILIHHVKSYFVKNVLKKHTAKKYLKFLKKVIHGDVHSKENLVNVIIVSNLNKVNFRSNNRLISKKII